MGGGGGAAPTPDGRIAEAAVKQAALGQEWLDFAKSNFGISQTRQAEIDALTKSIAQQTQALAQGQTAYTKALTDKQLQIADETAAINKQVGQQQLDSAQWQDGIARADRQRYEDVYRPIEDQYIQEASEYGSEARQDAAAAEAMADVQTAAATSRQAAQREQASLGINPNSGRWAGIDRAGELGTSLATAGAANAARKGIRDTGLSLKADLANLGRGVSAQALNTAAQATNTQNSGLNAANAGANLGIGARNTAISNAGVAAAGEAGALATGLNGALNANSQFLGSTGIMSNGFAGASAGQGAMANTLSGLHNADMATWQQQQQNNQAGWSAGLGAVGMIGGALLSSEEFKEDKMPLEEGEALDKVIDLPVEAWRYKEGVADDAQHVGTYAEDFQQETGMGDGRTIPIGDAIGLTMGAVKDLAQKVDEIAAAVGLGGGPGPRAKAKPAARPSSPPPEGRRAAALPPPASPVVDQAPGLGRRRAA